MWTFLARTDDLLRGSPWATRSADVRRALAYLIAMLIVFGMAYGAAMGTYGGVLGDRVWQVLFSAIKVPLLLSTAFLISLPSYFVVNTLLGLRTDFVQSVRALVAAQAGLAVVLAALGPLTILWYVSSPDTPLAYPAATVFNGSMFAVASLSAQWLLRRYYRPLVQGNPRHRWALRVWLVLYIFVAIQMAWVLRPFVGDPHLPVQFIRPEAWGNAYEHIAQMLWQLIRR